MALKNLALVLTVAAISVGCAYSSSGQSYPRSQARVAHRVEYGEVLSTRDVEIEGERSFIGVWGGAEVGRAVGDYVDDGGTRRVSRAVGGIAGAVAGRALERRITEQAGLEITVLLDSNSTVAVVQAKDIEFIQGERVRVLFGADGSARVRPL
jgi:outer membrane lipoprotein SlyB